LRRKSLIEDVTKTVCFLRCHLWCHTELESCLLLYWFIYDGWRSHYWNLLSLQELQNLVLKKPTY